MNLYTYPLKNKSRTVKEIKKAVNTYYKDLDEFPQIKKMSIPEFFDYVKKIPYMRDESSEEVVSRPKYLLTIFPALDCKKKSILFGSFMKYKYGSGSYRFILSSNRPDGAISHIFTQFFDGKNWINADCTYANNILGNKKRVTNFEIVKG